MTKIKICGITNLEDALLAADLGVDALGFIFAKSPRQITPAKVLEISRKLPPFISRVGVFVDAFPENINSVADICGLDIIQLHGSESPEQIQRFKKKVIKAFRIKSVADLEEFPAYKVDAYLLDSYSSELPGGTGKTFDWKLALEAKKFGRPIILSGGLTPENVAEAIKITGPYAVDASSGVEERPGKKDKEKLKRFVEAIRSVI